MHFYGSDLFGEAQVFIKGLIIRCWRNLASKMKTLLFNQELIGLLESMEGDIAKSCLSALQQPQTQTAVSEVPTNVDHLLVTYELRSSINVQKQLGILGYERLLEGLASLPDTQANIYVVTTQNGEFVIFADTNNNVLAGILKIPHRQTGLFQQTEKNSDE